MSEVKDLHNLVIERLETLNTPNTKKLSIILIGPPVSTRSSFTHVLKNMLTYFSKQNHKVFYFRTFEHNNNLDTKLIPANIELKSGNMEKLLELIQLTKPDLLFFSDYPEITDGILTQIQKKEIPQPFHVWQYFKPQSNVLSNQMIDWLSKKTDRIFVPFDLNEQKLKEVLGKKMDILYIPVSTNYFTMERDSVERIIDVSNVSRGKFRWLCPDRFNETSQIDTVVSAFAKYVTQDDHKEDQLLLLGNMGDFDSFPVFDIYTNEILNLGKDINDYVSNLIILNPDSAANITEEQLNILYNSCDYVVSSRNFCCHSFSLLNLASLGLPMLLPNHTWFSNLANDYSGVTLQPIHHAQYNTISSFGIKYFVNPVSLSEKMSELRQSQQANKNSPTTKLQIHQKYENFTNLLDKRIQILQLEASPN